MDILSKFTNLLSKEPFALKGSDRILIGVSGGSDSTCLVHLFKRAGYQIGLVHCNYNLRDEQSVNDLAFVKNLASTLHIPFYSKTFQKDEFSQSGQSVQMIARDMRYSFFEEIRSKESYDWIATAHHLEDWVETSLINWIQGCGVKGLRGIPAKRGQIIRPMITFEKKELTHFLTENQLTFRHDQSNDQLKYTRNKIRHQIIPSLNEIEQGFLKNMRKNRERMLELEAIESDFITYWKNKVTFIENKMLHIQLDELEKSVAPLTLLNHILKPYQFSTAQIEQIYLSKNKQAGGIFHSSTSRLLRNRDQFILQNNEDSSNVSSLMIDSIEEFKIRWGNTQIDILQAEDYPSAPIDFKSQIVLKGSDLIFPLQLRYRQEGDFFYPIGMEGKKKVSKLMKDLKIDQFTKEKIPILVNGNGDIIWILGLASDRRYQNSSQSTDLLHLKYVKI